MIRVTFQVVKDQDDHQAVNDQGDDDDLQLVNDQDDHQVVNDQDNDDDHQVVIDQDDLPQPSR